MQTEKHSNRVSNWWRQRKHAEMPKTVSAERRKRPGFRPASGDAGLTLVKAPRISFQLASNRAFQKLRSDVGPNASLNLMHLAPGVIGAARRERTPTPTGSGDD